MATFSSAKLFGMTIRESADDGSDFTNPKRGWRLNAPAATLAVDDL